MAVLKIIAILLIGVFLGQCLHIPQDKQSANKANHWALIIAGSSGWYNYRHQADACHAYHVMKNHGIPEENIVLMMYDDIAYNEENPTPGVVINHPEGKDVYGGIKIDYRREDVTPENFLAVMRGDKDAMKEIGTGRVIESGPNDHVFVNFADHGGPLILGFPASFLHMKDFIANIKDMYKEKKYKQMVFYIEACESGSMFQGVLPDDINVFATTAANAKESSYACYYDKELRTYLGDVYSVKWMEDSDQENLQSESLQRQYKVVKKETNTSHVQEFGDQSIAKEPVSQFQGGVNYKAPVPITVPSVPLNAVKSEDVPIAILKQRETHATTMEEYDLVAEKIKELLSFQDEVTGRFKSIVDLATKTEGEAYYRVSAGKRLTLSESNYGNCYQPVVDEFHTRCYNLGQYDYAMRHLYMFVNLCEENVSADAIISAIRTVC